MERVIGPCTLYNADCMDIMNSMRDKSVTLTLTDIPYGEVNDVNGADRKFGFKYSYRKSAIHTGAADFLTFDLSFFCNEVCRLTTGSIYIFCGIGQVSFIRQYLQEKGLHTRLLVWEKKNPFPLHANIMWLSNIECCVFGRFSKATFHGYCRSSVLRYGITDANRIHPTQKPLHLINDLLATSSNQGDVVFDPCMGSGTVGVSAIKHRRMFIGVEYNKEWFDGACKRIEGAYQDNRLLYM